MAASVLPFIVFGEQHCQAVTFCKLSVKVKNNSNNNSQK